MIAMAGFESSDFQRAFVRRLAHPDRERRAEALAVELARIGNALEARSIK